MDGMGRGSLVAELRASMLVALGLAGCYTRAIGPDDVGDDGGTDGESSDGEGSGSSATTDPTGASASASGSGTSETTSATSSSGTSGSSGTGTSTSDTGVPTCEVDPNEWSQVLVCMPAGGGECIPCDDDPVCRSKAEDASGACAPAFQYTLCGPEPVGTECCSVVFVEDWGCEGRPFIVDGEHRSAAVCDRDDWRAGVRPDCEGLDAIARERLGEAWLAAALAEHASIASFARFVLDLLSLGAPADLVAGAQRAMADEIVHARLAFGLAGAYLGRALGPGPLPSDGAIAAERDAAAIVRAAILEGCVGETVSAARAELALAEATDPAVRRALTTIARDERRHAQLAWQFVGWALRRDPSLRAVIEDTFTLALVGIDLHHAVADATTALDASARDHGVVAGRELSELTHTVAKDVIAPCFEALLDDVDAAAA